MIPTGPDPELARQLSRLSIPPEGTSAPETWRPRWSAEIAAEFAEHPQTNFLRALFEGPDPTGAIRRALGLPTRVWESPLDAKVGALLHEGSYPARMLSLDPELLSRPRVRFELAPLRAAIDERSERLGIDEAVASVRNEVYFYLAERELDGSPLEDIGRVLSALVRACVEAAMDAQDPTLREEVVVFAMGKLAGDELNYLSDVDFIFVHRDDPPEIEDATAAHARRTRIHQQLRGVLKILEGPARWRPVFRVDLRLRPFGSRGPLSLSMSATENYYERHGRDWERQVWLRGRPMCGALELGELLARRLVPFVYRRTLGPQIFEEVEAIMRRARREARRGRLDADAIDLKLDRGGIREIEFFVQAFQLMHGGRNAALRTPSTLSGLDRLAEAGLLSDRDHASLAQTYRWLRRVEHRVQLGEGQQTHRVPAEPRARALFARRLSATDEIGPGTPTDDPQELTRRLEAQLERRRAEVCEVTSLFGDDEAPQHPGGERRMWAREVVLDTGASRNALHDALEALGVRDPPEAAAVLAHLDARPDGPWRERGEARAGATRLLLACLDSADPDAALRRLAEFTANRPAHYAAWRYFADENHAEVVRRVADLFGASEPLSRGLIGFPDAKGVEQDGAMAELLATQADALPRAADFARAWAQFIPELEPSEGLRGTELDRTLLRFKARQFVRIGSLDLGRRADALEVGGSLSDLADLVVERLAEDLAHEATREFLSDPPEGSRSLSMVAFAMGKYGMGAMDYGSDLDLFFVFETSDPSGAIGGEDAAAATRVGSRGSTDFASKIARRFIARLQGSSARERLYEVDMRLRPSGSQGLLVSSRESFMRYHAKPLPIWERLALLRTRAVAHFRVGPDAPEVEGLRRFVLEETVPVSTYEGLDPSEIIPNLRQLKERIEREIARETRTQKDAKSGRGGSLEWELLVSALQLLHAPRAGDAYPQLRARDPLHALSALHEAGVLGRKETATLDRDYRFLRRLLNRLRMQSGGGTMRSPDRFDINSPRLSALARRMGVASAEALVEAHRRTTDRIRSAFDRHLS